MSTTYELNMYENYTNTSTIDTYPVKLERCTVRKLGTFQTREQARHVAKLSIVDAVYAQDLNLTDFGVSTPEELIGEWIPHPSFIGDGTATCSYSITTRMANPYDEDMYSLSPQIH